MYLYVDHFILEDTHFILFFFLYPCAFTYLLSNFINKNLSMFILQVLIFFHHDHHLDHNASLILMTTNFHYFNFLYLQQKMVADGPAAI